MPDLSVIAGAVSSLRTASEIAKALFDIRDQAVLQSKVIELQRLIVDAQSSAATAQSDLLVLIEQVRKLKDEIAASENWRDQAARYRLVDYGGSTFAYELIAESANGDPIHRACPKCFEAKSRSVLQFQFTDHRQRDHYKCHGCGSEYEFGNSVRQQPIHRKTNWVV